VQKANLAVFPGYRFRHASDEWMLPPCIILCEVG
jgi:hypothetical protein